MCLNKWSTGDILSEYWIQQGTLIFHDLRLSEESKQGNIFIKVANTEQKVGPSKFSTVISANGCHLEIFNFMLQESWVWKPKLQWGKRVQKWFLFLIWTLVHDELIQDLHEVQVLLIMVLSDVGLFFFFCYFTNSAIPGFFLAKTRTLNWGSE